MRSSGGMHDIKSSLPLQVCVYFHKYYVAAFVIVTFLMFIYKAVMLPYPRAAIALEVIFVFLYAGIETCRLYLTSRGNKLEQLYSLGIALVLAVPVIIFHAYYIQLQTYVLRLDQIVNAISLVFVGFEVLFGVLAWVTFLRASRF